jgi:hypothetical protein
MPQASGQWTDLEVGEMEEAGEIGFLDFPNFPDFSPLNSNFQLSIWFKQRI